MFNDLKTAAGTQFLTFSQSNKSC